MEGGRNKKDPILKNAASSTPAHLLASVLEQRYAHRSSARIKDKDEKPDPMTFPAVQKALGSVYSTIVEIVEEEGSDELMTENAETESADSAENVRGLSEHLLNMVDEIEQSEREREKEKKAVVKEIQKKKEDPYNRAVNYYPASYGDLDTIEITEDVAIETIVSDSREKRKN